MMALFSVTLLKRSLADNLDSAIHLFVYPVSAV